MKSNYKAIDGLIDIKHIHMK